MEGRKEGGRPLLPIDDSNCRYNDRLPLHVTHVLQDL